MPAARRHAGRALSADNLIDTGVAGLLFSGDAFDEPTLAAELGAYLSGPRIPLLNYAITDGNVEIMAPIEVVDGWELATPRRGDLASLTGIPSAATYVPRRSLHHDLYGGLAMLRRVDPIPNPRDGFVIYVSRPSWDLWKPLLVLSLYQNPVLHLWAQYEIEPARRVDVVFDRVYTEPWTPDGTREVDVVRTGDYEISANNEAHLRRFVGQLAPLLDAAIAQPRKPTKASRERAARFRRIAEHFLTAGEDAYGEGEVLSELNAEALLHYVIALEAVLTGGDDEKTELTRKIVQRAAILAGVDDDDRMAVYATVQTTYNARSRYAHGGEAENIDLPALRRIVRDCILARLVLGDPVAKGDPVVKDVSLNQLADRALLDHALLADELRRRISEFWAVVDADCLHGQQVTG
jgi:hypothetical protein